MKSFSKKLAWLPSIQDFFCWIDWHNEKFHGFLIQWLYNILFSHLWEIHVWFLAVTWY